MNNNDDKIIALYQKTRRQQPSAQLDDKILTAANTQLKHRAKKPKRIIWALSSVAVLVLSVNVGLKLLLEAPVSMAPPPVASSSPRLQQERMSIKMDKAISEKRIQKEVLKQKSRSMKQQSMPSPTTIAQQKPMPNALEIEFTFTTPPTIPFNVTEILKLNNTITALQKSSYEIQVYVKKDLILSLKRLSTKRIEITAYPQANELGLNINWALKPNQLNGCIKDQCALNTVQTAYFRNNTVIKVRWIQ